MKTIIPSPVLVMDALGLSAEIKRADALALAEIAERLDRQYLKFRRTVPHKFVFKFRNQVWGTKEFMTMRLGDMFILYAGQTDDDVGFKYLVAASLLYQTMLLDGFIPRGGIGFGDVVAGEGALLGAGFIDAYEASEKREFWTNNICAIKVSNNFQRILEPHSKSQKMLCFYRDEYFLNPVWLTDPLLGEFDRARILECLRKAGTNSAKYDATESFLNEFEDYTAAGMPGSQARKHVSRMVQRRGLPGPLW